MHCYHYSYLFTIIETKCFYFKTTAFLTIFLALTIFLWTTFLAFLTFLINLIKILKSEL
jgi:hypothetical protein